MKFFFLDRGNVYYSWGFGLTQVVPRHWMLYLNLGKWNFQLKFRRF